jgi:hypothetical protein
MQLTVIIAEHAVTTKMEITLAPASAPTTGEIGSGDVLLRAHFLKQELN